MTITEARAVLAASIRDQSKESDANKDLAILEAGRHFCRATRCITRTDSITITDGSTAFPLTTPIANGFRPECVLDAWITGEREPLSVISYADINTLLADDTSAGVPTMLAFLDQTTGVLWKEPNDDYTAKLRWWQTFGVTISGVFASTWTAGTATAGTLAGTLNIPDDLIMPVLSLGAASVLKAPSPEAAFASEAWKRFLDYEVQCAGAMNLGPRTFFREPNPDRFSRPSRFDQPFPGTL